MEHATAPPHNVIVIGSGPAGYTAALYAARARLNPVVFEGTQAGGALMTTTDVANYPGFPEGITGPALMQDIRAQAVRFGAHMRPEDADRLDLDGAVKTVSAEGTPHRSHTVILAMGAAPRRLHVPGEERLSGRGVSTCATCDGAFFRDRDIAVAGGGDSAMEEAVFLTRFARTVTAIHRGADFRASSIMLERARAHPKIRWLTHRTVTEVLGEHSVTGLRLRHTTTGRETTKPFTGLFTAIGHLPRSALVTGLIDTDDHGYVRVHRPGTHTTRDGVFAAGDLVDHTYRQAITAAASGCAAALDTERRLARRVPLTHRAPN
ncbi:thioredoxin-disulfide reductase [Streptomyces pinistramenti]|uniref:thioredoxin-disulfide reductase n=1 Tax=Streptomyces pinistramenti TaxID=2884812 RepID=UPI001D067997|nr:thioredoxin-disulfide reductase [Streptomyces pinistramenti]MCB5907513.1 thioredoxin-disulfide reductase [Streptomyces pinistramenti]